MAILLGFITLLLSIDQHGFTKFIYRPIVSCSIIGAILGDVTNGAIIGSLYELLLIAFEYSNFGNFDASSYFVGGIIATILCINGGQESYTAISTSVPIGAICVVVNYAIIGLSSLLLPVVRKKVEQSKSIALFNFLPLILNSIINAIIIILFYQNIDSFIDTFTAIYENNYLGWILVTIQIFAKLSSAIGLAILARNLNMNDIPSALCIGIVSGALLINSFGETSLLLEGLLVIAFVFYEYKHNLSTNEKVKNYNKSEPIENKQIENNDVLFSVNDKIIANVEGDIKPIKLENDPIKEESLKKMDDDSKVKGEDEVWW